MTATKGTLKTLAVLGAARVAQRVVTSAAAKAVFAKAAAAAGSSLAALAPAAGPVAAIAVVAAVIANEVRATREGREAFRECQQRAAAHALSLAAADGRARAVALRELPSPSWDECWRPSWVKDKRPGRATVRVPGGWVRRDLFGPKIVGPGSRLAQAALGRDLAADEFLVIPYGGLYSVVARDDRPLSAEVNFAALAAWPPLLERGQVADPAQALRIARAALQLSKERPGPEKDSLITLAAGLGGLAL